jgi:pimeloyl-ACP methyl ester carboxylesterase
MPPPTGSSSRSTSILVDFRELEGVGHFLMMEQAERFNAILREFLDRK